MFVALIIFSFCCVTESLTCREAIAKVNTQRVALQKVETSLHASAQTNSQFVACFESHYPLIQYGCEAEGSSTLTMNGEKSHIRKRIAFHDVGNQGLPDSAILQNALDDAHSLCSLDPHLQSTNFQGNVVCLSTPCEIIRMAFKNPLDGAIDSCEIQPQRDERKGVGLDEVFRLV
jgi:hypothetical protein